MVITDYYGNVVEWSGTAEDALWAGHNVNCSDCRRCHRCSDCSDCSGCSDCSDCHRCSGCSDCYRCSGCSGCYRCSTQPKANLITGTWVITVRQDDTIRIGCQDFSTRDWLSFDEKRIASMDPRAVEFMQKWKPVILAILGRT